MAIVYGSPCYPRWGSLTGTWRSYTQTWGSLCSPVTLPTAAASVGAGAQVPASVYLATGTAMTPVAGSQFARWGSLTGTWRSYRMIWRQLYAASALVAEAANGGALRPVVAAAPRMSRSRLTWRI